MSSINPHYTFHYSQPEAYRFSHDSVFLARRVFELVRHQINPQWRILDLCAGCGIVGLDFLFHLRKEISLTPFSCDFLEIQSDYEEHFNINKRRLGSEAVLNFLNQNYTEPINQKYDLILCNPPYFRVEEGKLSGNPFRNRCHFFMDATPDALIESIEHLLGPGGSAYVLSRNPKISTKLQTSIIEEVRGTPLVRYQNLS